MDIKQLKRELFEKLATDIKNLGYKVFITHSPSGSYGYIVNDKDEIGYFQQDDWGVGITFSTVHKPTWDFGTGFALDDHFNGHINVTKEIVDRCFIHHPSWATGKLSIIKKYTATEFFANYWNKVNIIEL